MPGFNLVQFIHLKVQTAAINIHYLKTTLLLLPNECQVIVVAMVFLQLLLCTLALLSPGAVLVLGCPFRCRCYSLTVECGSTGLLQVPPYAPPTTQTLFLQDNSITEVRLQDLPRLGQLHYLYLQNNSISVLEPGAFRSQGRLLELALNGNRIRTLSAEILQGLEHLRILYLAGNQITRLQDYTFQSLQRLQELHLQENSVEVVGEQALAGLSSLALLDLSRNHLHTLRQASLRPLLSLQVLRMTGNPWRCDCSLHWLHGWIGGAGERLLSRAGRRLVCAAPPRLSQRSLAEVARSSLVCIPPVVRLEPRHLALRQGADLRVSCQASGYPRPQVVWKRAAWGRSGREEEEEEGGVEKKSSITVSGLGFWGGEPFDPDTGSGMLLLSNVSVTHAGPYECEARNPAGVARMTFYLSVNTSSRSGPSSRRRPQARDSNVSRKPLSYKLGSMDFNALGPAPQTAIAAGIAFLTLTALLLLAMIYSRHHWRHLKKGHGDMGVGPVLFLKSNNLDGPSTFAQLEEYRNEMYIFDRKKAVFPLPPPSSHQEAPSRALSPTAEPPEERRVEGDGGEADSGEAPFLNQGLLFDSRVTYEIHC